MKDIMQRDDEVQDLRRPDRVGRIVELRGHTVRIEWPSGRTTTVRKRLITPTSRHYQVITPRPRIAKGLPADIVAALSGVLAPSTPTTAHGRRHGRWQCCACPRTCTRLLRPWRELMWNVGPWRGRSTVVCSDSCHLRMRALLNESSPPPTP